MRQLIAGPWVGEFGFELLSWQGYVRRISRSFDKTTVICPAGHVHLYADFAHEVIEHHLQGQADCWRNDVASDLGVLNRMTGPADAARIWPQRYISRLHQDFIRYDGPCAKPYDIVVHARAPYGKRAQDSWPQADWDALVPLLLAEGLSVAAVGKPGYALLPTGAADLRGLPLPELCGLLANAKLCVGPSSGPLHLASLCGCPHLVWASKRRWAASGNVTAREKFEKSWNPLQTPCTVIDAWDWRPPAEEVFRAAMLSLAASPTAA